MTTINDTKITINNTSFITNETEKSFLMEAISNMTQEEVADNYRSWTDRNISLILVNAEDEIDALPNLISDAQTRYHEAQVEFEMNKEKEPFKGPSYGKLIDALSEMMTLESKLDSLNEFADTFNPDGDFQPSDPTELQGEQNTSTGKEIVEFLYNYADRLSASELCTIYHTACHMHEDKEISWYHYLVIGIATTKRLAMQTKKDAGWWDECDRLITNKSKYQPRREIPTGDDSFHGEMRLDIENAIDTMRKLRPFAKRNNVSLEEAAAMMDY